MRIIVVLIGDVFKFPPVISLLNSLETNGVEHVLITTKPSGDLKGLFSDLKTEIIRINYESIQSPIRKMISIPGISSEIWKNIDKYYDVNSVIWAITDVSLKYLGKRLLKRNYIIHLLELSQTILYYKKLPFLTLNASKFGNTAKAVVVPEYNRAHITAAWWNLEIIPFVLPNKPGSFIEIEKESVIEDDTARRIIEKIGDKKIILYQGILNNERPLDEIIKAVDKYDGKYAFVVMSSDDDIYSGINSKNYYYIPYVRAPKHLQITSHAYIGVLSYVPTYSSGYSPLNSLYCAPNKTFEFSQFGIPMIGNDIPGLRFLFDTKKVGKCFESFDSKSICRSIDFIEEHYTEYSSNAVAYFNECNYDEMLKIILKKIEG